MSSILSFNWPNGRQPLEGIRAEFSLPCPVCDYGSSTMTRLLNGLCCLLCWWKCTMLQVFWVRLMDIFPMWSNSRSERKTLVREAQRRACVLRPSDVLHYKHTWLWHHRIPYIKQWVNFFQKERGQFSLYVFVHLIQTGLSDIEHNH